MRAAVITIAHGRHDHLRRQERFISAMAEPPEERIVVAMDDPQIQGVVDASTSVITYRSPGAAGLPLAAARNAGANEAIRRQAELLIFLDVDCLPAATLRSRYESAANEGNGGSIFAGPVAYLPSDHDHESGEGLDHYPFHSGRPAPTPGQVQRDGDHRLFWSLNFAIEATTWTGMGGFCESYVGYGAEDTDFAMSARREGIELVWVGGASAHHQWHPTSSPPVEHLRDILRNGAIFADRWGWWPMEGWLRAFCERGLIVAASDGGWRMSELVRG